MGWRACQLPVSSPAPLVFAVANTVTPSPYRVRPSAAVMLWYSRKLFSPTTIAELAASNSSSNSTALVAMPPLI